MLASVCALLRLLEEICVNLGATKCNEFGALKIDDTVERGWGVFAQHDPKLSYPNPMLCDIRFHGS